MKVRLIDPESNYDPEARLCFDADTLETDLGIRTIIDHMADGDPLIERVARRLLFTPVTDADAIRYRQDALRDAMANPAVTREIYALCVESDETRRKSWSWLDSAFISGTFNAAVSYLKIYLELLSKLKAIAETRSAGFTSAAFRSFFDGLKTELSDEYLNEAAEALKLLRINGDLTVRARLGGYLQGIEYVLCRPEARSFSLGRVFGPMYRVPMDDTTAAEDLDVRRNRAVNELTNALAQSAEHLLAYFNMLRSELAFYVGCLNLKDALADVGMPVCMPELADLGSFRRSMRGAYDAGVALLKMGADGNDLDFEGKSVYIITGANQGGKSTFLRGLGQAQLMGQCGMFVPAAEMTLPIREGVFTHFKKEEDASLQSGKLDEELTRMDRIVDAVKPGSLILFNESFAATNEREGSEICRQITAALADYGAEIFSVTHLMTFASSFMNDPRAQFLQAERLPDGTRTHRVLPGTPTTTAYGMDIYREVFARRSGGQTPQ